jgi:hypothetical protein
MDLALVDAACAPYRLCVLLIDVDVVAAPGDLQGRTDADAAPAQYRNAQGHNSPPVWREV